VPEDGINSKRYNEIKTMTDESKFNDDIAQDAKRFYQASATYCAPYFDRFLDNYKHYFLRIIDEAVEADESAYPFYSQIMLPISYQVVETILPRMFSRMPGFSIKTDAQNDERDELAIKELIKYQMNHPHLIDDPIFLRMSTALKEEFITGNAWGMVPWYQKWAEVEEWLPYSPEMGLAPAPDNEPIIREMGLTPRWMLVKTKKKVIDCPVFQHKSIFHVFPDAKKKRVGDMSRAIIEDSMTMDEVMDIVNQSPKDFQNIDELKSMAHEKEYWTGGGSDATNYDNELAGIFGSEDNTYKEKSKSDGQFKVWYIPERDRMSIVINEKLTIRSGANPNGDGRLGLFLMKDIPVPHELYAWGEPDPIKRLEDGMSDQFNMRNDAVFHDLLRMYQVNTKALVDGEDFIPEPGVVVKTTEKDAIQPIDMGSVKSSAYREYDEWEQIIQNTSGASDYATGQANAGMNPTAGGVDALQQAANARFQYKLQLFENLGLNAMGTMYVNRNIRFYDADQTVPTDKGKMTVYAEQLRRLKGNVMFMVESGSTEAASTTKEIQKWDTVTGLVSKNAAPFENLTMKSKDLIAKKVLGSIGVQETEEIVQHEQPQPVAPANPLMPEVPGVTPVQPELTTAVPNEQPNAPVLPATNTIQ